MKKILIFAFSSIIICCCTGNSFEDNRDNGTYSCIISDDGVIYNNKEFTIYLYADANAGRSKILSVDYYINGKLIKSIFSEPYSYTGKISDLPIGENMVNAIIKQSDNTIVKVEVKFTFKVNLGDEYQSGIIVHLSEDGTTGIIAAKEDVPGGLSGKFQWGYKYEGYGAYSETDGYANTQKFVGKYDDNFAAIACLNYREGGYDDWYLPSSEEFEYLKDFEDDIIPSRMNNIYWTSTQIDDTRARAKYFGRASITNGGEPVYGTYHYVRAIRKF